MVEEEKPGKLITREMIRKAVKKLYKYNNFKELWAVVPGPDMKNEIVTGKNYDELYEKYVATWERLWGEKIDAGRCSDNH